MISGEREKETRLDVGSNCILRSCQRLKVSGPDYIPSSVSCLDGVADKLVWLKQDFFIFQRHVSSCPLHVADLVNFETINPVSGHDVPFMILKILGRMCSKVSSGEKGGTPFRHSRVESRMWLGPPRGLSIDYLSTYR